MCAPRALGFVPSRVFMRYRGDNRIQAYSTKNRPVLGLALSFGEPQRLYLAGNALPRVTKLAFFGLHRVHSYVCLP